MTRGTIAVIVEDWNGKLKLMKSPEFNGDMGPDMRAGKELRLYFQERLFDASNAPMKTMEDIVRDMMLLFGYADEEDFADNGPGSERLFTEIPLDLNDYALDLRKKLKPDGGVDYYTDPWWVYFNGSDWAYVVNLTGKTLVLREGDGKQRMVEILPTGPVWILSYGGTVEYSYARTGLKKV